MDRIVRYGLVGIASNTIAFAGYLLLTGSGLEPKVAMTIVYAIAAVAGYWGNRAYTFQFHGAVSTSAMRYFLAHLAGYLTNWLLLILLVDHYGFPHQAVQGLAVVAVAVVLFVLSDKVVFTAASNQSRGRQTTGNDS